MEKFIKEINGNDIIFKKKIDDREIIVRHYDEDYIFDNLFIDDTFDFEFIEYVIKELKKTNDLQCVFVTTESSKVEELLYKNGIRVSNVQYTIEKNNRTIPNDYIVEEVLMRKQ